MSVPLRINDYCKQACSSMWFLLEEADSGLWFLASRGKDDTSEIKLSGGVRLLEVLPPSRTIVAGDASFAHALIDMACESDAD